MKRIELTFVTLLVLSGCTSYPSKVRTVKTQLEVEGEQGGKVVYKAADTDGVDELLAWQEKGRLCQLQGDYHGSAECYKNAVAVIERRNSEAVVRVSDVAAKTLASTYGNDLSLEYPAVGFERTMLHCEDAMSRLAIGDWDGFGIDMRHVEKCRNDTIEQLQRDAAIIARETGDSASEKFKDNKSYDSLMAALASYSAGVRYSTDNAFAMYLVGLYHEMRGEKDDACMAYADVERFMPNHPAVALARDRISGVAPAADEGEVIVVFEQGYVPKKKSNRFQWDGILTTYVSDVPGYSDMDCQPYEDGGPLAVYESGKQLAVTKCLCDTAPLAVKALEERMKGILARQVSRSSIKAITRASFTALALAGAVGAAYTDNGNAQIVLLTIGTVGSIGCAVMAGTTENADLRSWLLLPREIHLARFPMKAGKHSLTLRGVNEDLSVAIDVKPGEKTLVSVTSVPGAVNCFSASLEKVK